MEETNTTWKNHSFTLLIFGGIVALCFIFFVLGMLVGRNQGQKIAEIALADEAAKQPVADKAEEFPLEFYSQTTEEKPELKLQPAPETTAPVASSSSTAPVVTGRTDLSAGKPTVTAAAQPAETKSEPVKAPAVKSTPTPKPTAARTAPSKSPAAKEVFLQITASSNEKQAAQELKRVESKGFKAKILRATTTSGQIHRVVVGPYKESEVNLVKSDLAAKGYKGAFVPR
jgi:DedD protein